MSCALDGPAALGLSELSISTSLGQRPEVCFPNCRPPAAPRFCGDWEGH